MEFLDVVLHGVFSLKKFSTLVAWDGGCCVGNHMGVEIPLAAQS